MKPQDDPSWARYTATVLHFGHGSSIDLRRAVTAADSVALRQVGMHNPFAVITAENPRGRDVSQQENEQRRERLSSMLDETGVAWIPVVGASPDGSHSEHGAAVELADAQARELAVRFEQSAYYWFDGRQFSIHGALVDVAPILLPADASEP